MLDVAGTDLSADEIKNINHPNTGAVILFARNYRDPAQITALCSAIRAARNGPILIAVDQEGGRVQRFQAGFTRLPPASFYAEHPELAVAAGWLMAAELLAVGVDFSFAPVLDIDCGISAVIGNRSFSQQAELATQLASNFRKGMQQAGMAATGKHFPGHGAVALDSHLTLPTDERSFSDLLNKDLIPFKHLINEGLEGIMPAHVVYSAIDPRPAGFSPFWIQDVLRKQLNFTGTVFSDDLSMEGAASVGDFPERARLAQEAGCDMLLVCNNPSAAEQVLETLPINNNPLREQRLQAMRGKPSLTLAQLQATTQWQNIAQQLTEDLHDVNRRT
ncbi:MAG: beta-N-acetylhexosaminidase [Methylococcaceae bacterium]|nr:beta-N-acetylhexosaminidase [Methylococcaceae bacterium]